MNKKGKKLLAIALFASILCTGTVAAQAGILQRSVCGYDVWAETQISKTVASAHTNCASRDAATTVDATFYYIDADNHSMESMYDYHAANYSSIVYFTLPSGNNEAYEICANHTVEYAAGSEYGYWSGSTSAK